MKSPVRSLRSFRISDSLSASMPTVLAPAANLWNSVVLELETLASVSSSAAASRLPLIHSANTPLATAPATIPTNRPIESAESAALSPSFPMPPDAPPALSPRVFAADAAFCDDVALASVDTEAFLTASSSLSNFFSSEPRD
ncbi:hypothetical protein D3C85_1489740 [compost metagenome]